MARVTPALPVERQSSARDDRVHVRVKAQVAGPRVQDERGSERGGEATLSKLDQRPLGCGEQGFEDDARDEAREGAKLLGHGEHDVKVPLVEQALAPLFDHSSCASA